MGNGQWGMGKAEGGYAEVAEGAEDAEKVGETGRPPPSRCACHLPRKPGGGEKTGRRWARAVPALPFGSKEGTRGGWTLGDIGCWGVLGDDELFSEFGGRGCAGMGDGYVVVMSLVNTTNANTNTTNRYRGVARSR
jgi:hypothetical protein